ncbi:MAG: ribosome-associated translation inhibitor RaiA [Pedosphaera sp.]|nr:ribosome-associated translation inhibitor RaiA [Pedosphaera sp.]MSU43719.1 ribosome-associated translation inhibitor RaiA [Pedosphaera sp.]
MKLVLSAHKISLTEAIKDHLTQRIAKLEHLDGHAHTAFVNLEMDHQGMPLKKFTCTIKLALPGQTLVARDSESDLYAAMDLATKKIQQQIRTRHSRFKAKNHHDASVGKRTMVEHAA